MKCFLLLFALFVPWFYAIADDYDFSALQGLQGKKGEVYFEISGYDIVCNSLKGKLNSLQTYAKFKKQQKIKGIQAEYSDSKLALPNKIIETEQPLEKNPDIKYNTVYYLFASSENEIKYIVFQTLNQRDIFLEQAFITAFLEGKLESYISNDWTGESVSFAGRVVQLGTACEWRSPHNLYCKGGQVSWSEFSSAESAGLDLDMRIAANSKGTSKILSQDVLDVLFEGVPSIAYRVVYMGKYATYPLIVYYVAQEVRGKYLSCTMSNYGYNRNDYELSPLLQQFMSISTKPDWAYNRFDTPQYEDYGNGAYSHPRIALNYEIRLGSAFPLGNLHRSLGYVAPSLDFFMGVLIKQKMSIDIGGAFLFPTKRNPFDFTYHGETSETKERSLFDGSLRYRYRYALGKNLTFIPYLGIGFFSLTTNLLKGVDDNNNKTYQSVEALDLYAGIQLNYKRFGYFIEYHQTTLSNSSKVANDFGNSFLSTGLTYYFGTNKNK